MIKAERLREIYKYECEYLSTDTLIQAIETYIIRCCDEHKKDLIYMVSGNKYSYKTTKEAIKILKKNGYKVKVKKLKPDNTTLYPIHIELTIRWW